MKNYAYITLLSSEDYLDAVLVLAMSLNKTKNSFPLVVAVVDDILTPEIEYLLKNFGCQIEVIPRIYYSTTTQNSHIGHPVLNTASKIQIFDFNQYDKLIYIDSDVVVLENIDSLFNYPDGSMVYYEGDYTGLTGLFIIEPKNHRETRYYLSLLENFDVFDGNLIGEFWFHILNSPAHQIPREFFWHYNPELKVPKGIKMVHYCNTPKPWLEPNASIYSNLYPFAKIYKEHLKDVLKLKEKFMLKYKN